MDTSVRVARDRMTHTVLWHLFRAALMRLETTVSTFDTLLHETPEEVGTVITPVRSLERVHAEVMALLSLHDENAIEEEWIRRGCLLVDRVIVAHGGRWFRRNDRRRTTLNLR